MYSTSISIDDTSSTTSSSNPPSSPSRRSYGSDDSGHGSRKTTSYATLTVDDYFDQPISTIRPAAPSIPPPPPPTFAEDPYYVFRRVLPSRILPKDENPYGYGVYGGKDKSKKKKARPEYRDDDDPYAMYLRGEDDVKKVKRNDIKETFKNINVAMFGRSRNKDRDKHGTGSSSREGATVTGTGVPGKETRYATRADIRMEEPINCDDEYAREVREMNTEQLVNAIIPVLQKEMAIPAAAVQRTLDSFDDAKMRHILIQNANRDSSDKKKQTAAGFMHQLTHDFNTLSASAQKKILVMLRVALGGETVQWVKDFVEPSSSSEGGMKLLSRVIATTLNNLSQRSENDPDVRDYIGVLTEAVRSARAIFNTFPGLENALKRDSSLIRGFLQALALLTTRTFRAPDGEDESGYGRVGGALQTAGYADEMVEARQLRIDIVQIVSSIAVLTRSMLDERKVKAEMTGRERIMEDLGMIGRKLGKSRFRPIIKSMERGRENVEHMTRLLAMANVLITFGVEEFTEDQAWQQRVSIRNELMRDGIGEYIEYIGTLIPRLHQGELDVPQSTLKGIEAAYNGFIESKNEDFQELICRFENLKGDFDSLDGCYEILRGSSKNTPVESTLLSIFQHLMLVSDSVTTRTAYFRLIESCVSEIVLHRSGVDPDFNSRFHFETNVADMIEHLENAESSKRLESAVQAKHEAAALSLQYYDKLKEFEAESTALRKHLADPKCPLPPPTQCSLKPPSSSSSPSAISPSLSTTVTNGLPPVTGGPPPPPPPGGLPPVTGGPPPPPPPPGGLPRVTGGPPPPPPPPGGPPPPPPLPPVMGGGPPPPPPPPPPPGGFKGPGGPPPPPMLLRPQTPPLPDFLKKKKKRDVGIPMRKNYWTTIKPQQLEKDSLWAQINEEKHANDKRFEEFKSKFASSKSAVNGGTGVNLAKSAAKAAESKKKQKRPIVLQDEKVLQALAILQGSAKMSHSVWKRGLLEVDEKLLTAGLLGQLRAALPPLDVLKKLAEAAKTSMNDMPEGEQFAASVASINALPLRLDLMVFKMRFNELLGEIKPELSAVTEACDELRTSKGLKTFIELLLLYSNYMHSSAKNFEVAYAFEMSALPKVLDTKDNENHHTFLHYIILQMREQFPAMSRFVTTELHHVPSAARVNPDETAKAVASLKANLTKLENALKTYVKQGEHDRFMEVMTPFLESAQQACFVVETLHKKMLEAWSRVHKFFGFDPKKYGMEQFFGDMKTFKEQYENVSRELDEEEAKTLKEKEAAERKKREPLKPTQPKIGNGRHTPNSYSMLTTAVDSPGVLDELDKMFNTDLFHQPKRSRNIGAGPRSKADQEQLQLQQCSSPIGSSSISISPSSTGEQPTIIVKPSSSSRSQTTPNGSTSKYSTIIDSSSPSSTYSNPSVVSQQHSHYHNNNNKLRSTSNDGRVALSSDRTLKSTVGKPSETLPLLPSSQPPCLPPLAFRAGPASRGTVVDGSCRDPPAQYRSSLPPPRQAAPSIGELHAAFTQLRPVEPVISRL